MATLPTAPSPCTFDSLGLFTHGEFRCYQSPNPCLSLFTHGEFPRAAFVAGGVGAAPAVGTGAGRRRGRRQPEIIYERNNDEAIILSLLLAEEEDDWW